MSARRLPIVAALFALAPAAVAAKTLPALRFTWTDAVLASGKALAGPGRFSPYEEGLLACPTPPGLLAIKANLTASGALERIVYVHVPDGFPAVQSCVEALLGTVRLPTPVQPDEVRFSVRMDPVLPAGPKLTKAEKTAIATAASQEKEALKQLILEPGEPGVADVFAAPSQARVLTDRREAFRSCGAPTLIAGQPPLAAGNLTIQTSLDGSVKEASFEGSGSVEVAECWLRVAHQTLFAPGPGYSTLHQTLALRIDPKVSGTEATTAELLAGSPAVQRSLDAETFTVWVAGELAQRQATLDARQATADAKVADAKAKVEARAAAKEAERAAKDQEALDRAKAREAKEPAPVEAPAPGEVPAPVEAAPVAATAAPPAEAAPVAPPVVPTSFTLVLEGLKTNGALAPEIVQTALDAQRGPLDDCLAKAAAKGHVAAVEGTLGFRANADGSIGLPSYGGDLLPEVGDCFELRLRKLKVSPSAGETEVSLGVKIVATPDP